MKSVKSLCLARDLSNISIEKSGVQSSSLPSLYLFLYSSDASIVDHSTIDCKTTLIFALTFLTARLTHNSHISHTHDQHDVRVTVSVIHE
jgi:hypothetical protein